jgi:hypothetical protein
MAAGFFLLSNTLGDLFEGEVILENVRQQAEDIAPDIRDAARQNAPWTDQTGDARAGLDTEVDNEGTEVVITLSHGVDYGIWLETIQSGRFAIIMPTLEAFAEEIFSRTSAVQIGEDLSG